MAGFFLSEAEVENSVCDDMSIVSKKRRVIESLLIMLNMTKMQKITKHLITFLEIIMMQLMILCLVLIFLKKRLIIILMMKFKDNFKDSKKKVDEYKKLW